MKKRLFTALMALLVTLAASAQSSNGPRKLRYVNPYAKETFENCLKAAKKGIAEAQLQLAELYEEGIEVDEDESLAFEWCRKAAEKGLVKAQNKLGEYYEEGIGVVKDEVEAFKWYLKAAATGDEDAAENVDDLIEDMPENLKKDAFKKFLVLARKGVLWAQEMVADFYDEGIGTEADEAKAEYWEKEYEKNAKKQK